MRTIETSSPSGGHARRRVGLYGSLALAMGVGPLLLYGLAATAPLVISEFALNRTEFGLFASTAFVSAAVSSGFAGRLVDRYSERRITVALYAGAGASLGVAAFSWSYASLLVAVVISGAAQALSNPVTNRLVSTHVGERARGLATGIKQSGVQMAQLFAGTVLPTLAIAFGWRGALGASIALTIAGLVLSLSYLPHRSVAVDDASENQPGALPAQVWFLAAFALLTGAAMQATNVYLPLYGYERLDLPIATAGLVAAVVGGVGLVGRIGWGYLSGAVRKPGTPMLVVVLIAALGSACIGLAGSLGDAWLLWVGAVIFGVAGIAANVVVMLTLIRTTPLHLLGQASGALSTGLYLGFAIGPVSFGALVDQFGGYGLGWAVVTAAYVAAALLVAIGGRRLDGESSRHG
jgi:MFS family permease